MFEKVNEIRSRVEAFQIGAKEQLEQFRNEFTSRKGAVAGLMEEIKNIAPEQRKAFGQAVNELKELALGKFKEYEEKLQNSLSGSGDSQIDYTLPPVPNQLGTRHPLDLVRKEIVQIFERIGFNLSEGPEIEDDWHNFSALNFPENHPAREMQDTFFVQRNPDMLLRTHTSSVQV
ncbi:MAG: phenylalanine--tRNA ligase subunit alpha, partial [Sphingobacteriales bacterium]